MHYVIHALIASVWTASTSSWIKMIHPDRTWYRFPPSLPPITGKNSNRLTRGGLIMGLFCMVVVGCSEDVPPIQTTNPGSDPPVVTVISPTTTEILDTAVVEIAADDDRGIVLVDVFIDNRLEASFVSPPFSFVWDARLLPDSSVHTLFARASDADNQTSLSPVISFTAFCLQPDELSAAVLNDSTILLSWRDNSRKETGFEIERKINDGPFARIADLPANETSIAVSASYPYATDITFRIRAVAGGEYSAYTEQVSVRVTGSGLPGYEGEGWFFVNTSRGIMSAEGSFHLGDGSVQGVGGSINRDGNGEALTVFAYVFRSFNDVDIALLDLSNPDGELTIGHYPFLGTDGLRSLYSMGFHVDLENFDPENLPSSVYVGVVGGADMNLISGDHYSGTFSGFGLNESFDGIVLTDGEFDVTGTGGDGAVHESMRSLACRIARAARTKALQLAHQ
jgi:hypothetical protein